MLFYEFLINSYCMKEGNRKPLLYFYQENNMVSKYKMFDHIIVKDGPHHSTCYWRRTDDYLKYYWCLWHDMIKAFITSNYWPANMERKGQFRTYEAWTQESSTVGNKMKILQFDFRHQWTETDSNWTLSVRTSQHLFLRSCKTKKEWCFFYS